MTIYYVVPRLVVLELQMAALTNSASLLESDYLAYRQEGEEDRQQGDTVNKIRGTMDNIWTRLRKGWGKKTPVVKGREEHQFIKMF